MNETLHKENIRKIEGHTTVMPTSAAASISRYDEVLSTSTACCHYRVFVPYSAPPPLRFPTNPFPLVRSSTLMALRGDQLHGGGFWRLTTIHG